AMALIEPACARELATTVDDMALTHLRAAHHQASVMLDTDSQAAHSHHGQFHQLLVDLAGNQTLTVLAAMIRHILEQTNRDDSQPATTPDTPTAAADAHDHHRAHTRLLDLLSKGDADGAERHWRSHVTAGQQVDET
nr:FCD domain-containing protein [Micromonospora sp. DSM 115978]